MTALEQPTQGDNAIVRGGRRLTGEVRARGSKNCALPLMAAALLTKETCVLHNPPFIRDVAAMADLLTSLGARVELDEKQRTITITADKITSTRTPTAIAASFRASFLVTGPLLSRAGEASSVHPGGCKIGERPVNVDLLGFEAMGATVESQEQDYRLSAKRLNGARLYLDYPSHTGTENLMLAATLAQGTSVISMLLPNRRLLHWPIASMRWERASVAQERTPLKLKGWRVSMAPNGTSYLIGTKRVLSR